jgi:signal transduction histidine kinase
VPKSFRSITFPIVLGVVAEVLTIALLVGWILVIIRNAQLSEQVAGNTWLMVGGIVSFVVIGTVLVLFNVFLVREILEGRRQVRFIDSVTHELKSPLAALKLCVETLDRRDLPLDKRHEVHSMMLDDIDRLSAFIDDVLQASRVGYGAGDRAWSEVHLDALAERCVRRVRARHKVGEDAVIVDVPPGLRLLTDETALEVVLRNLLDNAVKYSDDDIYVVLHAHREEDEVHVHVRDRGIGIPLQHMKRIFDRFYRAPVESVNTRRGTGLGLYVASQLVRQLGGSLEASSAGPGRGTTMAFALPASLPAAPAAARDEIEAEA